MAQRYIDQLAIKTPSLEQPIEFCPAVTNRKFCSLAGCFTKPKFLILMKPTRGIDVGAHAEIIRLIESLCANGLALLVISSELEELVGLRRPRHRVTRQKIGSRNTHRRTFRTSHNASGASW